MRGLMVRSMVVLGIALLGMPQMSAAQEHERDGFWFSAGLGYGTLGCQDCAGREGGLSGNLGLGGTLSQKVLLGVATHGWTKSEQGVTLTAGTLTAAIRFYPSATGGFFLNGGLGVGLVELDVSGFGNTSETGFGAVVGLGYDIRVGSNVSLTPFLNGIGLTFSDGDANFGQTGLAITVH